MKVIDQTPFFKSGGKINPIDQARATMKFGAAWVQETQAQTGVMTVLERGLDKRFTLLRNITLPGSEISIPFILVGPPGVFILYVTALRGMYRAKGDMWGTTSGDNFRAAAVNLLVRSSSMARAVQVYLQRNGYEGVGVVEPILLCADPGMHVDSVRPIVRIVQSDALERFAVSVGQSRDMMSVGAVGEVVNRLLNPKPPKSAEPAAPPPVVAAPEPEPYVPDFAQPDYLPSGVSSFTEPAPVEPPPAFAQPVEASPVGGEGLGFDFKAEAAPVDNTPFSHKPVQRTPAKRKSGFSARQWLVLVFFGVIECIAVAIFLYVIFMQNL